MKRATTVTLADYAAPAVAAQLTVHLAARWQSWARWLPAATHREIATALHATADRAAGILDMPHGNNDAETCRIVAAYDTLDVLFGGGDPPAEWWATPLGQAVARAFPDRTVTYPEAARILGLSRQRVHVLARDGLLTSPVTGYVTLSSVLARLTTRKPGAPH